MRSMFQKLRVLMSVLTLSIPFVALAEQNSVQAEAEVSAVQDADAVRLETIISAERDATHDINKCLWFGAGVGVSSVAVPLGIIGGCLVGELIAPSEPSGLLYVSIGEGAIIGSLVGGVVAGLIPAHWIYTYESHPPSERLLGKSPEYVAFYTDAYMSKARSIRRKWAAAGAATGCLLLYLPSPFSSP